MMVTIAVFVGHIQLLAVRRQGKLLGSCPRAGCESPSQRGQVHHLHGVVVAGADIQLRAVLDRVMRGRLPTGTVFSTFMLALPITDRVLSFHWTHTRCRPAPAGRQAGWRNRPGGEYSHQLAPVRQENTHTRWGKSPSGLALHFRRIKTQRVQIAAGVQNPSWRRQVDQGARLGNQHRLAQFAVPGAIAQAAALNAASSNSGLRI